MLSNNLEYTRTLWHWCTRAEVPFVYASSAATYGDGAKGFDDESDPSHLAPLNLYGKSKHLFDLWALEQVTTPPRWAGLKYFNVYGPRESHKGRMASVAYHAYCQIRDGGRVRLFKSHRDGIPDGGQQRDFVFVEDAVAATLHFWTQPPSPDSPNGLYNIGTGQARSFADLARAVFTARRLEPAIDYIPMPEDLRERYQYFTQARNTKLQRAGYEQPFHSIEDGVAKYVAWLEKMAFGS
jgi:ADP-L-glycero-D-manno-heptose 6-epimerase